MAYSTTNDNNFQVDPDTGEVLHVCPCCGQHLPQDFPHEVLTTVDPLSAINYDNALFKEQTVIFDNYLLDVLRLEMKPASFKVVCFLIRHTKGHHNDPRPRSFTYQEIKEGTGITSDGTLWASIAELGQGNEALNIPGLDIIRHDTYNGDGGNRYHLNTERERPGEPLLFYANSGQYTPMHESLIDYAMPLLEPSEWSLFCFIFRKTIGWHKQEDCLSLSQMREASGLRTTPAINANLKRLQSFRVNESDQPLFFEISRSRKGRLIRLNSDFYFDLESRGNRTGVSRQSNRSLAAIEPESRGNRTGVSRQSNPQNMSLNMSLNNTEKQHETTTETPQPNQPCKPVDVQLPEQQKGQNNQDEKTEILIQLGITWANVQQQIINRAENDLDRLRVGLDHKTLHPGTGAGLYVKWLKGELDLKWRHEDADGPEPAPVNGNGSNGQGPGLSPGFYQAIGLCPEWEAAKAILKSRMGGATFSLLQDADAEILGDTMVIKSYRADFIQNRLGELIAQAVATACGRQISLEFQVLGVECHE